MSTATVYRTEGGMMMRVLEADDGGLKVQVLRDGAWMEGRIGMIGLRLSPSTVRLTPAQVKGLPK